MSIELLDKAIRRVPDFPKPGILFYDVTGIFINPDAFKYCIDRMESLYKFERLDGICGVESRGFLLAAPLAERLGIPLVLIRKKGKLPGDTYCCKFALEYGTSEIEVHKADVKKDSRYLVVDDLIATGGTLSAVKKLLEMAGASVAEFFGVIGLPELNYEKTLFPTKVTMLIQYSEKI
ncbi:MAG: adenine phosphoribosyltransferase [Treponema sp.]|nr:adenine phosphoribosyltransferase [Treponema sp.]